MFFKEVGKTTLRCYLEMDLAPARGSRSWEQTPGRRDAHPSRAGSRHPRLRRQVPATPVPGPLLPPLRAAGKDSPAPGDAQPGPDPGPGGCTARPRGSQSFCSQRCLLALTS